MKTTITINPTQQLLNQALNTANQIQDLKDRAWALRYIAVAMAEAKQFSQALQVANKIQNLLLRAWALAGIAKAMAEAKQFSQALQVANKIQVLKDRAWALAGVAVAMAEAKQFSQALQVANKIQNPQDKAWALAGIAKAMAEAGLNPTQAFNQALQVANKIQNLKKRAWALRYIAVAMAGFGGDVVVGVEGEFVYVSVDGVFPEVVVDISCFGLSGVSFRNTKGRVEKKYKVREVKCSEVKVKAFGLEYSSELPVLSEVSGWIEELIGRRVKVKSSVVLSLLEIRSRINEIKEDRSIFIEEEKIEKRISELEFALNKYKEILERGVIDKGLVEERIKRTEAILESAKKQLERLEEAKKLREEVLKELEDKAKIIILDSLVGIEPTAVDLTSIKEKCSRVRSLTRISPILTTSVEEEFARKYEFIRLLGEGGFASVYLVKRKSDGRLVVLKIPRLCEEAGRIFLREIYVWKTLKHSNIVELYDANIVPAPYLELEYVEGVEVNNRRCVSLRELPKPVSGDILVKIIMGVVAALEYAHGQNVWHLDLTPNNILLKSDYTAKVSDWGLAKIKIEESPSLVGFTPQYAAPEQLSSELGEISDRTDIYQLGLVIYELTEGRKPFKAENVHQLYQKILSEKPEISPKNKYKHIIEKCLKKNPNERYKNIKELKKEFEEMFADFSKTLVK